MFVALFWSASALTLMCLQQQSRLTNGLIQCQLGVVQEFADWIVTQDNSFEMAYAIDQDKVANMTIRLQFNSDSKWTKALKYMLTNLKYCLKWAITHQKLERNASAARTSQNHMSSSSVRQ